MIEYRFIFDSDLLTHHDPLGGVPEMISLDTLVQIVTKQVLYFHDFLLYAAGFLVFFVSIGIIKKIARV